MIFQHVHTLAKKEFKHIRVEQGIIKTITDSKLTQEKNELTIDCSNFIVFPGLINSHDHLDFNLYPPLANKIYTNYTEWGADIHQKNGDIIDAVKKIPHELRVQWGIYKNLLNGVTTVVNHGKVEGFENSIITVFQHCYDLHSPRFEKNWKWKLNRFFKGDKPFVIHLGEGTDISASEEINEVIDANYFKRKIVAVHAVAMNTQQAAHFAAVVWCPYSNYFLLNKTSDIQRLKEHVPILFGTDSTLTSSWNLWEHMRKGVASGIADPAEILEMLTATAAKVWGLQNCGLIAEGQDADIVVAVPKTGNKSHSDFLNINPEEILLVMHKGNIVLADERLSDIFLSQAGLPSSAIININGAKKWVQGNLDGLIRNIRAYYPEINLPVTILKEE